MTAATWTMAEEVERLFPLLRPAAGSKETERSEADEATLREDLTLAKESLNGGEEAFGRLIARHQQHVAAIIWKFARDAEQHETLVHDVFVEAYVSLKGYRGRAPLEHWLARIATRVGYRHWKQEAKRRKVETAAVEEWKLRDGTRPTEDERDRARLLKELMKVLKPRDRLMLTLRYVEGYDVKEVARMTGFSESLVKVQSMRARQRLRRLYDQAMKDER